MPWVILALAGAAIVAYEFLVKPGGKTATSTTKKAATQPVMKSAPAQAPRPIAPPPAPAATPDVMLDTSGATQLDDTAGDI